MGAVTAIMYGDRDPTIAGLILDSPFSSLKLLVEELVKDKVNLPQWVLNQALKLVKSTVLKKAKFKLDDIEPINYAERCFIPALFVAAKDDNFVKPHHAKMLHDVYPGDKNIVSVEGDHNTSRPRFFKDSAAIFFYNTLQVQFIKDASDNYAGLYKQMKENKKTIVNPNKFYKEEPVDYIGEKLENFEIDNEEDMFNKILEMSRVEYENEVLNDLPVKEEKEEKNEKNEKEN
jgi:hypothetical protein